MPTEQFPVLTEQQLDKPARRFFGAKRDNAELPGLVPGTVLVFENNGRYQRMSRRRLVGNEPVVVQSMSVSLVSTRARLIEVDLVLPSASPADEFTIRVRFRCQVTEPEVVAEAGLTDITARLIAYLMHDQTLAAKCAQFYIDDIATVRATATARVVAYCTVHPPRIDGLHIEMVNASVFTPEDLRTYSKNTRDEKWRQSFEGLRQMGETQAVEYLTDMLRTPEGARALAVSRGDIDSAEAAKHVSAERAAQTREQLELIKIMADQDRFARVPVDIRRLFDSAVESLTGWQLPNPTPSPVEGKAQPSIPAQPEQSRAPRAEARFIPDEDDLVNWQEDE
jgi:hypothetical protein